MADDSLKIKNAILVNEFTEFGVECFKARYDDLRSSNYPVIPVIIDSFGGEIYSLMAMLDLIKYTDRPIMTIALGKAMSCGTMLLAAGTPGFRFIGPNTTVMIHDAGSVSFGKIEDLKADVGEAERLNDIIYGLLDQCAGKKPDYFKKLVAEKKHANWYLSADEALKHGLVDKIGIPVLDPGYTFDLPEPKSKKTKKVKKVSKKKSEVKKKDQ